MHARLFRPLVDLAAAPRGLWIVIGAFAVEGIGYFGILTLMTSLLQPATCIGPTVTPA